MERWQSNLTMILVLIACTFLLSVPKREQPKVPDSDVRVTPVVRAVARVRPAVVNIYSSARATPRTTYLFGPSPTSNLGAGVIISPDGYVVTNVHVLTGNLEMELSDLGDLEIEVRTGLEPDRALEARLMNWDVPNDLALLKILDQGPFPTVTLGRSDDLMIGETVIAVGNP